MGRGVRTRQYNPGAINLAQYVQAAMDHVRGSHDAAGKSAARNAEERAARIRQRDLVAARLPRQSSRRHHAGILGGQAARLARAPRAIRNAGEGNSAF